MCAVIATFDDDVAVAAADGGREDGIVPHDQLAKHGLHALDVIVLGGKAALHGNRFGQSTAAFRLGSDDIGNQAKA
jgi:hypothetical protein